MTIVMRFASSIRPDSPPQRLSAGELPASLFLLLLILACGQPALRAQSRDTSAASASASDSARFFQVAPDRDRFFIVGATIGSPTSLSLTAGYYLDALAVRISGAYWNSDWYGIEGSLGVNITRSKDLIQTISIVAGKYGTSVSGVDAVGMPTTTIGRQNYIGGAYTVYYSGFLLQLGLGSGSGDFPNPQFIYHFGYTFH